MKFFFIVQGEGRGHMTQAMALFDLLEERGHKTVAVVVGSSKRRSIPGYFSEQIQCPIHLFASPNFVTDKNNKSIKILPTLFQNLKKTSIFFKSLKNIHHLVQETQPDIILNFYDILGGLYNLLYAPPIRFMTIGHQYLIFHPDFPFAKSSSLQKQLFILNTKITALGAKKMIALSFWDSKKKPHPSLVIWPPVLRKKVKALVPATQPFFLAYIVNSGYSEEIFQVAKKYKNTRIEAFWDEKYRPEKYQALPNLVFHQVNEPLFLNKMATCQGLMTTAGFESVAEAMYLGKKVLMVPVKGQYEQQCNALDAVNSGAGAESSFFDLSPLKTLIESQGSTLNQENTFKIWQNTLESHVDALLDAESNHLIQKTFDSKVVMPLKIN